MTTTQRAGIQMSYVTIIGLAAAAITTISLFPQLLKVWKTKSTKDISLGTFLLFCGGVLLWFIYGVLLNDLPIMIANSLGFIQGLIILIFKIKYK
jgi:MtN3 and saliva related transmembrane protein